MDLRTIEEKLQVINAIQNAKHILNVMDNANSITIEDGNKNIKIEVKREKIKMDKITIAAANWAKEFVKNNSNKVKSVEEIYKEGFIKGANLQKEANLHKIKSLEEQNEQNKEYFEKLTDSLNKEKENKESENPLSEERIQKLLKKEKILNALESYGVDNWEGYEMAMDSVEED